MSGVNLNRDPLDVAADYVQSGRYSEAKTALEELPDNQSDPRRFLLLAQASQQLGDLEACSSALDRLLTLDPHLVRGWLMKGELAANAGRHGEAICYFERALSEACLKRVSDELKDRLSAAETWLRENKPSPALKLKQELTAAGIDAESGSRRFQHSLDVVFGEKTIYPQRPNVYFLPGLPQIQFFDREDFA